VLTEYLVNCIRQQLHIVHAKPLIVAVSGGTDSVALVHALANLRSRFEYVLHIATLEHGLRGEAGGQDVRFVRDLAQQLNLPCYHNIVDTRAYAQSTNSGIEAAARQLRYAFLAEIAHKVDATVIVTAHHAGDQAETVLMHLLRGAGLHGLSGMVTVAPVPNHDELTLFRPLLGISKQVLIDYCVEHELTPREDLTNQDVRYLRNAIRHRVLPHLQAYNPNIEIALNRLADSVGLDDAFIQQMLDNDVKPLLVHGDERIIAQKSDFLSWHPALQRRCLMFMVSELQDHNMHPTYDHLVHAMQVAQNGRVGAIAQFSGGIRLRVDYEKLIVEHESTPPRFNDMYMQMPASTEVAVNLTGTTNISGVDWQLTVTHSEHQPANAVIVVPQGAQVMLRTRRPGDRFSPPGLRGRHKKLKSWMIDQKIPREHRDQIPLLEINGHIVAIVRKKRWVVSENLMVSNTEATFLYFYVNYS